MNSLLLICRQYLRLVLRRRARILHSTWKLRRWWNRSDWGTRKWLPSSDNKEQRKDERELSLLWNWDPRERIQNTLSTTSHQITTQRQGNFLLLPLENQFIEFGEYCQAVRWSCGWFLSADPEFHDGLDGWWEWDPQITEIPNEVG